MFGFWNVEKKKQIKTQNYCSKQSFDCLCSPFCFLPSISLLHSSIPKLSVCYITDFFFCFFSQRSLLTSPSSRFLLWAFQQIPFCRKLHIVVFTRKSVIFRLVFGFFLDLVSQFCIEYSVFLSERLDIGSHCLWNEIWALLTF